MMTFTVSKSNNNVNRVRRIYVKFYKHFNLAVLNRKKMLERAQRIFKCYRQLRGKDGL